MVAGSTSCGESHAISKPLLLQFAGNDAHIDAATIARIRAGLEDNRNVEIVVHEGVDHGFATETGKRRDTAAAEKADALSGAFFRTHLG